MPVLTVPVGAERLVTETCYLCNVLFAMPESFRQARLDNHRLNFFCPLGHSQVYTGETPAEKYERLYHEAERRAGRHYDRVQETERRLSATRGVVTRLRNRAHAGTCPFGCRRHFANLERHVAAKHPGEKLPEEG